MRPTRTGRCRHSSCNEMCGLYPRIPEGRSPLLNVEETPLNFAAVMGCARIVKGPGTYIIDQYRRVVEDLKIMQQVDEPCVGKMENGERRPRNRLTFKLRWSKGYPSDIFADPQSEKKKKKQPEDKFDENRGDLPIMYHLYHEAHFGPSPSSVSRSETLSQNEPEATLLAMKLREEFSPTPPHITLLIRVDNWLLAVCPQEEHRSKAVGEIR